MVFDYNGDGVADLLLSRHMLAPTELFRGNSDGTYTLAQALPTADRHFCAPADFNNDGRPDFYCSIGADKGTATNKSNELWLQGVDGRFASVAGAWGAADPMGRGRDVAAADFNNDGLPDLFVGNGFPVSSTNPSPNPALPQHRDFLHRCVNGPGGTEVRRNLCAAWGLQRRRAAGHIRVRSQ